MSDMGSSKRSPGGLSSASTSTSTSVSSAELASLFECSVCYDYVLPPIFQCRTGHLFCSNCRVKLTRCPSCRGILGKLF